MNGAPKFPFDLTGYTCFSLANCSAGRARRLLEEYPNLCAPEGETREFSFRLSPMPDAPEWTAVLWPRPGRFYDLLNLTMWLMGYNGCPGGETPLFIALPPEGRKQEGPLLARPDYDDPFMASLVGYWQGWSFDYTLPGERLRWIGRDVFPQDYFFYGRGYSNTGFRLEWLERQFPGWEACPVRLEE